MKAYYIDKTGGRFDKFVIAGDYSAGYTVRRVTCGSPAFCGPFPSILDARRALLAIAPGARAAGITAG